MMKKVKEKQRNNINSRVRSVVNNKFEKSELPEVSFIRKSELAKSIENTTDYQYKNLSVSKNTNFQSFKSQDVTKNNFIEKIKSKEVLNKLKVGIFGNLSYIRNQIEKKIGKDDSALYIR